MRLTVPVHLAPLSWTNTGGGGEREHRDKYCKNGVIDTPFVTSSVDENITVYDKATHEAQQECSFEDRGDIGNEYIPNFNQKEQNLPISKAVKSLENTARFAKICSSMKIDNSSGADEKLDAEQRGIIEFMTREAGRSEELATLPLKQRWCLCW